MLYLCIYPATARVQHCRHIVIPPKVYFEPVYELNTGRMCYVRRLKYKVLLKCRERLFPAVEKKGCESVHGRESTNWILKSSLREKIFQEEETEGSKGQEVRRWRLIQGTTCGDILLMVQQRKLAWKSECEASH